LIPEPQRQDAQMSEPGEVRGVSRLCSRDARPGDGAAETRKDNLHAIARLSGQRADPPHKGQLENPYRPTPLSRHAPRLVVRPSMLSRRVAVTRRDRETNIDIAAARRVWEFNPAARTAGGSPPRRTETAFERPRGGLGQGCSVWRLWSA
jgi:hypothetical protein